MNFEIFSQTQTLNNNVYKMFPLILSETDELRDNGDFYQNEVCSVEKGVSSKYYTHYVHTFDRFKPYRHCDDKR